MKNPNKPPCIRNLYKFQKSGCPQKCYDGKEGCTGWMEIMSPDPDNPLAKKIEKGCIDILNFRFQYTQLMLLEGNQHALESFRNGMTEKGKDGTTMPKINPNIASMFVALKDQVDVLKKEHNDFKELIVNAARNSTKKIDVD